MLLCLADFSSGERDKVISGGVIDVHSKTFGFFNFFLRPSFYDYCGLKRMCWDVSHVESQVFAGKEATDPQNPT